MLITSSKIRSDERTTLYLDSAPPYIIWLSAVAISHFDGKEIVTARLKVSFFFPQDTTDS